ncbi:MAG: MFS transporter [Candidatus Bathyarchaeota archaeon]|jgi:MFS family permease
MGSLESFLGKIALEGNIRVLALQILISQVGFGMFYVIWQPLILSTGATVAELGVIQSLINLITAAGLILWGVLSDRLGRKPVILASYICRIIAMTALIKSGSSLFLYVFAFFVGLSCLFNQGNPAVNALISESVGRDIRATAFSAVNMINRITSTIVASAGGYIAVKMGYYPIIYIALVGDIVGTALITLFIKETHRGDTLKTGSAEGVIQRIRGHLMPERGYLRLYAIMIVIGFAYNTGYSVFFGMLVDNFGFTEIQLGLLSTTFNLVAGITAIPLGRLSDRFGRNLMLKVGWVMGMTSIMGFILSRKFEFFLLFYAISALDMNLYLSAWMPMVSERAPPKRLSTILGKLDSYSRFAGIPAPWLGGQLYTLYGFRAPLFVHIMGIVVYGVLILTLREK